jgi:hypothetical protein
MTENSSAGSEVVAKRRPFYKKKRYMALAVVILYFLALGVINLPKTQAESRYETLATKAYTQLASTCFKNWYRKVN